MPSPTAARIYLHLRWPVSPNSLPLTVDVLSRLTPYLMRYGQTLQATVFAVGGGTDHVHLLLQIPTTRTVNELMGELQAASARFVREVLNVPSFAWHEENAGFVESVGLDASEKMGDYIRQNWEVHATGTLVPQWENADSENRQDEKILQSDYKV